MTLQSRSQVAEGAVFRDCKPWKYSERFCFVPVDNILLHTQFSQLETIEIVLYVTPRSLLSGLMALSDEALEEIQKEIPTFFSKTTEIHGVLVKSHVFNHGTHAIEMLLSGFWEGMRSTTTKGRAEIKSGR